jgi:hypothetical protein
VTPRPDFDELIGTDVPEEERERLRRAHDLLLQAGPPPELSPELESVPWPDDALEPIWGKRKEQKARPFWRRPVVLAAALATAAVLGFFLGNSTGSEDGAIDVRQTLELHGTILEPAALATLKLGHADRDGNWPMVLRVEGLPKLQKGGYYDLYLTKGGKPLVSCGTFNADGRTTVRMNAAYNLERFDENGWVIVRKVPGHFQPDQIVLKPDV